MPGKRTFFPSSVNLDFFPGSNLKISYQTQQDFQVTIWDLNSHIFQVCFARFKPDKICRFHLQISLYRYRLIPQLCNQPEKTMPLRLQIDFSSIVQEQRKTLAREEEGEFGWTRNDGLYRIRGSIESQGGKNLDRDFSVD